MCSCNLSTFTEFESRTVFIQVSQGGIFQATGSLWKERKRFCWYWNTVDNRLSLSSYLSISLSFSPSLSLWDDYHFWMIFYGSLSIYSAGKQRQEQREGKDWWKYGWKAEALGCEILVLNTYNIYANEKMCLISTN